MSVRSKLLATVAIPMLSILAQPALADRLTGMVQLAQENGDQPPEGQVIPQQQHKKRQPAAEEAQPQAKERKRARQEQEVPVQAEEPRAPRAERQPEAEGQKRPQRRQIEERQAPLQDARPQIEEPKLTEPEARRPAAEQKKAKRKAVDQPEDTQPVQKNAAPKPEVRTPAEVQPKTDQVMPRKAEKRQKPIQENIAPQTEEQPGAPEKSARPQTGEAPQPQGRPVEKQGKKKPADATPEGNTVRTPAEAQPKTDQVMPRKAEKKQKPIQENIAPQTEEQPGAPEKSARPQTGEELQPQGRLVEKQGKKKPADVTPEGGMARTPDRTTPDAPQSDESAPRQPSVGEPAGKTVETPKLQPQRSQTGAGQPATEQSITGEGIRPPAPPVIDKRTTEEKRAIARDPAKTDETVVLPVENGAAILDSDKDADNTGGDQARTERRKLREKQRTAEEAGPPPADDASAQRAIPARMKAELPKRIEANLKEEGTRVKDAPAFALPETTNIVNNTIVNNTTVNNVTNNVANVKVLEQVDNRVILDAGDQIFVRGDDRPRLRRNAEDSYYDQLPRGRTRETIVRPGGYRIVTVYDQYGDIVQRSRIDRDGNEYLMMYAPEYDDAPRAAIGDVGYELPPMRLTIPVEDYIVDVADDPDRDYYDFLAMPPVEQVERVYTIDEVRHSARLRDKVRRIDLDTIHFATGSAEISLDQAKTLRKVADAIEKVLARDPAETFFIEGHTDAVGSDRSNLVLSDQRAESVASLLTEVYDIPAENLVTQGYGERFLKIRTEGPEEENRRVTIRRVTPLVRPVAQR